MFSALWAASVLVASTIVYASPLLEERQGAVTPLTAAEIASFTPYAYYAATASCAPATTLAWNCGCELFRVLSSGQR
jgi:hypothetical protein